MENFNSIKNESFRFDISISDRCYNHKPTHEEHRWMSFHVESLCSDELIEKIKSGYSICHIFKYNRRIKQNFMSTNTVFFDVDNSTVCMSDFLSQCNMKPTMAYTTTSNGLEGYGYRYRLIFVFDTKIMSEMLYTSLYTYISEKINLKNMKDKCGSICNQLMNGNTKTNIETYCSYLIYSFNSSFFSECSLEYTTPPPPRVYSKEHSEKNRETIVQEANDPLNEKSAEEDTINLLMHDIKAFLDFYEGNIGIIDETIIDYNENGYGFYPEDYYRLFYRYDWKEKKIIKYKNHEKRRNRLYIDACLMRRIKPEITFQELLYNLVLRRQRYYDNSDGVLTNKFLIDQARKALSIDYSKIQSLSPCKHGVFRVNKEFCQQNGTTPRKYSRVVAGIIHQEEISKWYNPNKSLSENLSYAKETGIKISRKTLSKYCLDMGLNTEPRRIPPEQWYDVSLSVTENLQIALDSDIKTSKASLYKYCKEHGINPKGEK